MICSIDREALDLEWVAHPAVTATSVAATARRWMEKRFTVS
jgi:hypothetical protein